jgi:hypothetical protein
MNPEVLKKNRYGTEHKTDYSLANQFVGLSQMIRHRAIWLLDFATDSHPALRQASFQIPRSDIESNDHVHNDVIFLVLMAEVDLETWEKEYAYNKVDKVREAAQSLVNRGIWEFVLPQINQMNYLSGYRQYEALKAQELFSKDYRPRDILSYLVDQDVGFKEKLQLIVYFANLKYKSPNDVLAVFAVVVGFAQAYVRKYYSDDFHHIDDEKKRNIELERQKQKKHTMYDSILWFGLRHFDRNMGAYLAKMNQIELE